MDVDTEAPFAPAFLQDIRSRFHHVERCPVSGGPRVYLENGGGSLKLKSAMERLMEVASRPDQEGRQNASSINSSVLIQAALDDIRLFVGDPEGTIISGETGTECVNRITQAVLRAAPPGPVLSSPLEHPATFDIARLWAERTDRQVIDVPFDPASGRVEARHYASQVTPDTQIAMIVHTSQTTGMRADLPSITAAIRAVAPDCFILVDGVQHAAHGAPAVLEYGADAYVFSPYKVYCRSGKGFAWLSPRAALIPHDRLLGSPQDSWQLGGRDAGLYAAFAEVVAYFRWLGAHTAGEDAAPRDQIIAAGAAMRAHEQSLLRLLIHGGPNVRGLLQSPGFSVIGESDLAHREGVTAFRHERLSARSIEQRLEERGVRVVSLVRDVYSRHVLEYLGVEDCVRATVCHYNTHEEMTRLLQELAAIDN